MSVRRGVTWFGILCALAGVAPLVTAAPAAAVGETVRVDAPSGFTAGGSPGAVTVKASMRRGDCVSVRTRVGLQLPGLTPSLVRMQVAADGAWRPVPVATGGDGFVVSARTAPRKPELCAGKSVASRYRVFLLAGAPPGRVTVLGEAYTAGGRLLGQDIETARMTGQTGTIPLPTRSATPTPTPTPTPEETEAVEATEETGEPTADVAAALPTGAAAAGDSGGGFGIGTMVMLVGLVMVGIGIALLVVLIRRGRTEPAEPAPRVTAGVVPPVDALPTAPIQRGKSLYGRTASGGTGGGAARVVGPVGPATAGRPGRPGAGGTRGPQSPVPASPTGDRTQVLPTAGFTRPRPAGSVPSAPAGAAPSSMSSGFGPVSPASADAEPTRWIPAGRGPAGADPEPTRAIPAGQDATQRIPAGQDGTPPIARGQDATQRIPAGQDATPPIARGQDPNRRIAPGAEPAAGIEATFVLPPTPPREP
ncbi:hypothetical protein [Micromonospora sp. HM5-17]|uniref:hypothetical protein n=1 Tax=Micromonospora sp. HM5-17 TaxID=2487710 RepID=UPI0011CE36AA|nr:hypothetical protein [Micromonospora sp. HM5-17]